MKGFVAEFKAFAMKGNVIDLAVAVVIGTAFGKITTSLVNNIIMPLLGIVLGGIDLTNRMVVVGNAEVTYGVFLQSVLDFIFIALIIFLVIKAINRAHKAFEEEAEPEPEKPKEPSEEVKLLREIRDNLKR